MAFFYVICKLIFSHYFIIHFICTQLLNLKYLFFCQIRLHSIQNLKTRLCPLCICFPVMTTDWKSNYFPGGLAVPKPHLPFEAQLVAGKSHRLSLISCPQPNLTLTSSEILRGQEKHEADLKYPQRLRRLHIFPTNQAEVVCKFICLHCKSQLYMHFNKAYVVIFCRECCFYCLPDGWLWIQANLVLWY